MSNDIRQYCTNKINEACNAGCYLKQQNQTEVYKQKLYQSFAGIVQCTPALAADLTDMLYTFLMSIITKSNGGNLNDPNYKASIDAKATQLADLIVLGNLAKTTVENQQAKNTVTSWGDQGLGNWLSQSYNYYVTTTKPQYFSLKNLSTNGGFNMNQNVNGLVGNGLSSNPTNIFSTNQPMANNQTTNNLGANMLSDIVPQNQNVPLFLRDEQQQQQQQQQQQPQTQVSTVPVKQQPTSIEWVPSKAQHYPFTINPYTNVYATENKEGSIILVSKSLDFSINNLGLGSPTTTTFGVPPVIIQRSDIISGEEPTVITNEETGIQREVYNRIPLTYANLNKQYLSADNALLDTAIIAINQMGKSNSQLSAICTKVEVNKVTLHQISDSLFSAMKTMVSGDTKTTFDTLKSLSLALETKENGLDQETIPSLIKFIEKCDQYFTTEFNYCLQSRMGTTIKVNSFLEDYTEFEEYCLSDPDTMVYLNALNNNWREIVTSCFVSTKTKTEINDVKYDLCAYKETISITNVMTTIYCLEVDLYKGKPSIITNQSKTLYNLIKEVMSDAKTNNIQTVYLVTAEGIKLRVCEAWFAKGNYVLTKVEKE